MSNPIESKLNTPLRVVVLRDKKRESLIKSASGGAFPVLARPILRAGGVVFGAEMLAGGVVEHTGVSTIDDLSRLQGSKYVQSEACGTFPKCAEALKKGNMVLWSGTPCQVFALRSYLERRGLERYAEKYLYTVDLICHGVTNPKLFKLYISWLETKHGAIPGSLQYEFRSKRMGWGLNYYYRYLSVRDGRERSRFGFGDSDPYYAAFLEGKLYRQSCYSCKFARGERVGDYTIGDYWGVQNEHPDFDYSNGASVLLINNTKAQQFFDSFCTSECVIEESNFESASKANMNLVCPTCFCQSNKVLQKAVKDAMMNKDADTIFDKLLHVPFTKKRLFSNLKRLIRWLLPDCLVRSVKTIKGR